MITTQYLDEDFVNCVKIVNIKQIKFMFLWSVRVCASNFYYTNKHVYETAPRVTRNQEPGFLAF